MFTNNGEEGYLDLGRDILANGSPVPDRTGVGTTSVFGRQLRFDLSVGFPLLTTKRVHRKSIVHELLWFLSGDTNIKYLKEHDVTIWDAWADENGELGPVYGKQWRSWDKFEELPNEPYDSYTRETIDQIANVVASLTNNPHSRRHIVSAWNPAEVDDMALPPCHCLFQFRTRVLTIKQRLKEGGHTAREWTAGIDRHDENNHERIHTILDGLSVPRFALDCQLYQRSADYFLGVPFNIASYALLTHMLAHQLNMVPGEFVHTFGDVHIYNNHRDQVSEQLSRTPVAQKPTLRFARKPDSLFDYKYDDFIFANYAPLPAIKAPVAV